MSFHLKAIDPSCQVMKLMRISALVILVGCSTRPVEVSPPEASAVPATPQVAPQPTASAPAAPSSASTPAASSTPPPSSNPMVFGCGATVCAAGKETCCEFSTFRVCTAASGGTAERQARCEKIEAPYSFSDLSQCDESVDCGASQICCEQWLHSGSATTECVAADTSGKSPCDYGEVCVEGSPCRVPGTVCAEGYCVKPPANVQCGDATCGGTTPACCGEPPACAAESSCDWRSTIRCARDADCVSGHRCMIQGHGTRCGGAVGPVEHLPLLCETARNCPRCTTAPNARPTCEPSLIPGLKSCECPYE